MISVPPPRPADVDRPTLLHVAERCGVSKGAVSLALNRPLVESRLREGTYRRIRQVAAELGYRPDWRARALANRKTHNIGLLFGGFSPHVTDVYASFIDTVTKTLATRGYHLNLVPVVDTGVDWRDVIADERVEGCLVMPPMPSALVDSLKRAGLPAVLINELGDIAAPQYIPDDTGGMTLILQHLYDLGHRRIAFCLGEAPLNTHHSVPMRREAFAAFIAGRAIADTCAEFIGSNDALADHLAGPGRAMTAVVCYKASFGVSLLQTFWRRGIRVPADMSLATIDDSWLMAQLAPPLTSVHVPLDLIGERAATDLIDRIESGAAFVAETISVPERLIVRESTAAPRALAELNPWRRDDVA